MRTILVVLTLTLLTFTGGLLLTLILRITGHVKNPPAPPDAATEARLDLGSGWSGTIVVLPTGERVLLTYRYHGTTNGGQISTAAVLLPPLSTANPEKP